MSNKSKYIAITTVFTAAAVCAFFGAYRAFNTTPKITVGEKTIDADYYEVRDTDEASMKDGAKHEEEPAAMEALSQKDRINENTTVVYEYYYEDAGKTERAEQKAPYALLSLTREQLVAKIEGFSVESFSTDKVVLRKKIGGTKSSRYILGVWEGRVAVFYGGSGINQNGLKEVTDTPVTSLSPDEQERLQEGIVIEGDGELMKVLEDFGS